MLGPKFFAKICSKDFWLNFQATACCMMVFHTNLAIWVFYLRRKDKLPRMLQGEIPAFIFPDTQGKFFTLCAFYFLLIFIMPFLAGIFLTP